MFFFLFNDTATTEIYTYLTHSFPSRRSSDLAALSSLMKGRGDLSALVGAAQRRERGVVGQVERSEEHTSELQSLMRISYAVFCLKKKKIEIEHKNLKRKRSIHNASHDRTTHVNTLLYQYVTYMSKLNS